MIQVSQRSRYGLRALFELAKRHGNGPVRISDIAQAQAIPPKYLEAILNQLKQVGLVRSVRGAHGGYVLTREPRQVRVGELIRVTEGPPDSAGCPGDTPSRECPFYGNCVFQEMWRKAGDAVAEVYDSTTFQDLIEQDRIRTLSPAADFCI